MTETSGGATAGRSGEPGAVADPSHGPSSVADRSPAPDPAAFARAGPRWARLVAPVRRPTIGPLLSFRLHVADRALVPEGARIEAGQPIVERARETALVEVAEDPLVTGVDLGTIIEPGRVTVSGRNRDALRPGDHPRLLYHTPDGRACLAVGRHPLILTSPVGGEIESIGAGELVIRADGIGLPAAVGWGMPVHGPLLIAVSSPDAELRASAIDVGAAGSIVVAGARLDIEALTRARAIGAAGVLCGGIVGRELRQIEESDRRQRAALHATAAFAVMALDGYGRRPIPGPTWDLLVADAGEQAGMLPEARMVVVSGDVDLLARATARPPGWVRITGGDGIGREGFLAGLAGPVRRQGGVYEPAGFVDLAGTTDGETERKVVPLADMERIG